jgi:hypothetical protein
MDKEEVVVDAPFLYKGALAFGDNVGQDRSCRFAKILEKNLREAVDEAYRPIITDRRGIRLLRNEDDICRVDQICVFATKVFHMENGSHNVNLDDVPT